MNQVKLGFGGHYVHSCFNQKYITDPWLTCIIQLDEKPYNSYWNPSNRPVCETNILIEFGAWCPWQAGVFVYSIHVLILEHFSAYLAVFKPRYPQAPCHFYLNICQNISEIFLLNYQITWSLPLNYLHPSLTSKSQPFSENFTLCLCQFVF